MKIENLSLVKVSYCNLIGVAKLRINYLRSAQQAKIGLYVLGISAHILKTVCKELDTIVLCILAFRNDVFKFFFSTLLLFVPFLAPNFIQLSLANSTKLLVKLSLGEDVQIVISDFFPLAVHT